MSRTIAGFRKMRHCSVVFFLLLALLPAAAPAERPALGHKLALFGRGLMQMVLSTEGHAARRLDCEPDPSLLQGWATEHRTVVFVRHGESTWNEMFNRGRGLQRFLWMPLRLARGLAREAASIMSTESTFIDSPLSPRGIQQAGEIRKALRSNDDGHALLAEALAVSANVTSVLVASNLRRAVETGTLALADRLAKTGEQMFIRSELQEISRNLDAVSLAPALSYPTAPRDAVATALHDADLVFDSLYCADGNRGNKAVFGHQRERLARFADFCFGESKVGGLESLQQNNGAVIVAVGHSLWFKTFFRMYIDRAVQHELKERKISNSGVVSFTLERGVVGGRMLYRILPHSIHILHGQFV